jgi:hypothetical protein
MCHLTYIYSMMLCKNKKEWVYMAAYSIPMVTCHACKLKKKTCHAYRWVRPSCRRQIALLVLSFWRPGALRRTEKLWGGSAVGHHLNRPAPQQIQEREREGEGRESHTLQEIPWHWHGPGPLDWEIKQGGYVEGFFFSAKAKNFI